MNKLITALQNPQLYPHPVQYIRLIETHTSYVLLTGNFVYKIKKAVNYGFLDYSTLEARLYYCKKELEYNTRTASDLYLAVVPIYGTQNSPRWIGDGEPIEYAVKMQQFDEEKLFSQLIIKQHLSQQHVQKTAEKLALFHQQAEVAKSSFADPKHVTQPVAENFSQITEALALFSTPASLSALIQEGVHWFEFVRTKALRDSENLHSYFLIRHAQGFIRACHGDLHLNNIILIDEQPVFFDCVEFNEDLRWIDVTAEIAFLTMDLIDKDRPDLANLFLNHYLELTGDYGLITGLGYYQSYRAMVRAKVALLTSISLQHDPETCQHELTKYVHYLKLAHSITQPLPQLLLLMHGLSGSGKSSVSSCFLPLPNFIRLRADVERKRLANLIPHQHATPEQQALLYTERHTARTFSHLLSLTHAILQAGFSVVVDATFLQQALRQNFIALAQNLTIAWFIVHTSAPPHFLITMLNARLSTVSEPSDATLQVLEQQIALREPLTPTELTHTCNIASDQINLNAIAQFCHYLQAMITAWRYAQPKTRDNIS